MLGHLGINVVDLEQSRVYYRELMPMLGFESFLDREDEFAYRPAGGKPGTYLFFYPKTASDDGHAYSPEATGLQHAAFMVRTRAAVDEVHRWVVDRGEAVVHAPQVFPQYPQPYYACFWSDPSGFTLEAVCHHDR